MCARRVPVQIYMGERMSGARQSVRRGPGRWGGQKKMRISRPLLIGVL